MDEKPALGWCALRANASRDPVRERTRIHCERGQPDTWKAGHYTVRLLGLKEDPVSGLLVLGFSVTTPDGQVVDTSPPHFVAPRLATPDGTTRTEKGANGDIAVPNFAENLKMAIRTHVEDSMWLAGLRWER